MALVQPIQNEDTIRERLAAVGILPVDGADVVVSYVRNGKWTDILLASVAETDPAGYEALYSTSAVYVPKRSDKQPQDRKHEFCHAVIAMPFDCDLAGYFNLSADEQEELYEEPIAQIDDYLEAQRRVIESTFAALKLPIHRLDITGHGHCAYIYVDPQDRERVADIRATHKALVEAINTLAGFNLVDPKVSDAGSRVTRIPGSFNNKGSTPKPVRTLYYHAGQFERISIVADPPVPAKPITISEVGSILSEKHRTEIINAIRPSWTLGQKHNLSLAVAAHLGKAGVPESEADSIIAELAGEDLRPDDRKKSVRDTYARLRSGSPVQGYTALTRYMPDAAVSFVDRILTQYREANTPKAELPTSKPKAETKPVGTASSLAVKEIDKERRRDIDLVDRLTPIPDELFYGWFARYRDVMGPTTEAADAFHLGAMLTVVGAMIGRTIGMQQGSDVIYPNLFTILVGASGWSRKDTAIDRAMDHIRRMPKGLLSVETIEPFFAETTDITSAEGLLKELKEAKNHRLLARISEITSVFVNMERPGTKNLGDRLIRLWDNPAVTQVARSNDATKIENPSFSMIAATQPGRLATAMTHEHVISGLANRGLWIAGSRKCVMYKPPAVNINASWALYTDLVDAVNSYKGKALLPIDPGVDALCEPWYRKITADDGSVSEESESMRSRHQTLANKIALIYAVSDQSDAIYAEHMEPAIAFVEWMWSNLQILMKTWGISNFNHIQQRIESVLREKGSMNKRELSRQCSNRRWNIAEYNAVLAALQRSDRVFIDPQGIVSIPEAGK